VAAIDLALPFVVYMAVARGIADKPEAATFILLFAAVVGLRGWLAEWRMGLATEFMFNLERALTANAARVKLFGEACAYKHQESGSAVATHFDAVDAARLLFLMDLDLPAMVLRLAAYPIAMAVVCTSSVILLIIPFALLFLAQRLALSQKYARLRDAARQDRNELSVLLEGVQRHTEGLRFISFAAHVSKQSDRLLDRINGVLRRGTRLTQTRVAFAYAGIILPYLAMMALFNAGDIIGGQELLLLPLNMLFLQLWQALESTSTALVQAFEALEGAARIGPSSIVPRPGIARRLRGTTEVLIEGVTVRSPLNGSSIIQRVTCRLQPGTITLLTGGNGSGKTTLCRVVAGLLKPAEGIIRFNGRSVDDTACRAAAIFVPQESVILEGTILGNLFGHGDDARALERLREWSIIGGTTGRDGSEPVSILSTGQRQRLALVRALAHRPFVLLLDEALSHQDRTQRTRIWHSLREASRDSTILLVSHDAADELLADQILHVEGGRLQMRGRPQPGNLQDQASQRMATAK